MNLFEIYKQFFTALSKEQPWQGTDYKKNECVCEC